MSKFQLLMKSPLRLLFSSPRRLRFCCGFCLSVSKIFEEVLGGFLISMNGRTKRSTLGNMANLIFGIFSAADPRISLQCFYTVAWATGRSLIPTVIELHVDGRPAYLLTVVWSVWNCIAHVSEFRFYKECHQPPSFPAAVKSSKVWRERMFISPIAKSIIIQT